MSESSDPRDIERVLAEIAAERPAQELVFDPRTGTVAVTDRPTPDAIVATDTARSGYFTRTRR